MVRSLLRRSESVQEAEIPVVPFGCLFGFSFSAASLAAEAGCDRLLRDSKA